MVLWMHQCIETIVCMSGWRMMINGWEGLEWTVRKWKSKTDRTVECVEFDKQRNEMVRKEALELYKKREVPNHKTW